jgi:hypothetical protein
MDLLMTFGPLGHLHSTLRRQSPVCFTLQMKINLQRILIVTRMRIHLGVCRAILVNKRMLALACASMATFGRGGGYKRAIHLPLSLTSNQCLLNSWN